ncbi:hypothetical protein IHE44_0004770, partial [Lamprotornis superbus]
LVQYVNGLFLDTKAYKNCLKDTICLCTALAEKNGHPASLSKLQLCHQETLVTRTKGVKQTIDRSYQGRGSGAYMFSSRGRKDFPCYKRSFSFCSSTPSPLCMRTKG